MSRWVPVYGIAESGVDFNVKSSLYIHACSVHGWRRVWKWLLISVVAECCVALSSVELSSRRVQRCVVERSLHPSWIMESNFVHVMSESMLSLIWSRVFVYTIVESMLESNVEFGHCVRDGSVQCCVVERSMLNMNMESSFVHAMSESILSSMPSPCLKPVWSWVVAMSNVAWWSGVFIRVEYGVVLYTRCQSPIWVRCRVHAWNPCGVE